jgi:alpha-ribazole phosphatase
MTELILIRHTRVAVTGVCYGRSQVALADSFVDEVNHIKAQLVAVNVSAYYTSPAQRCLSFAVQIASKFTVDERLSELDFGAWEGLSWDDIDQQAIDLWAQDYVNCAPPFGESYAQLAQRVAAFIRHIPPLTCIVVITHAGVIRAVNALLNNIPLVDSFIFQPECGELYRYSLSEFRQ